jgi:hypothetical protein
MEALGWGDCCLKIHFGNWFKMNSQVLPRQSGFQKPVLRGEFLRE